MQPNDDVIFIAKLIYYKIKVKTDEGFVLEYSDKYQPNQMIIILIKSIVSFLFCRTSFNGIRLNFTLFWFEVSF